MRLKRFVGRWKWVQENTLCFFFQAEDGIRDVAVTGVQTCALPLLGFDKLSGVARPQNERDNPFRGGKQLGTLEFKGESQAPLDTMIGASLDARQFSDLSRLSPEQLVTPTEKFYVRTAASELLDPSTPWMINVSGLVQEPVHLTLDELHKSAKRSEERRVGKECRSR